MQLDLEQLLKDMDREFRSQPQASIQGGTPGVSVGKALNKRADDERARSPKVS